MAWEGAFGLVPKVADSCVMSGAFVVYELDRKRIEPRFLEYFFKVTAHWQAIGTQSTGTNVRRQSLHPTHFEKSLFPLPPLPEQRRIVARIEELAVKINEARGLRQMTMRETEALITSGGAQVFDALINWPRQPIHNLGENGQNPIQIGPFGATLHRSDFVETGVPVLNVGNVWPEGLRLDYVDRVSEEKAKELSRYTIKSADLLFARSGATLGKVCIVPPQCDGWLMTGHLFRIRFDSERVLNRFAFAAFTRSRQIQEQVFGQVRGATRPGYNTTLLGKVELPVPPLCVQRPAVDQLDAVQNEVEVMKKVQVETSAELDALLPSILDRAFTGDL